MSPMRHPLSEDDKAVTFESIVPDSNINEVVFNLKGKRSRSCVRTFSENGFPRTPLSNSECRY